MKKINLSIYLLAAMTVFVVSCKQDFFNQSRKTKLIVKQPGRMVRYQKPLFLMFTRFWDMGALKSRLWLLSPMRQCSPMPAETSIHLRRVLKPLPILAGLATHIVGVECILLFGKRMWLSRIFLHLLLPILF
jgi:hypothetical protein